MMISAQQAERILKTYQSLYPKNRVARVDTKMKADKLELSSQAQEVKLAKDLALKSADVRADKIDEIKKQINAGTYQRTGMEIASKMIERSLVDEVVGR